MSGIVVFITAPGEEEAAAMARALVEERLAACVNIVRDVRSIYRWEGKIEDDREALMVVKTREDLFDALSGRVRELHGYSVPEVIALPILKGLKEYLQWLEEQTGGQ
jgi:periplasmic divalent cation tolerance protein